MDSQTLYCCLKQIKENKKKVILMALRPPYKKETGLSANAMRIQAEENRKMYENIKPLKLPSNNINKIKDKIKNIFKKKNKKNQKEKPGYFKKRRNSQVTWNY